ncbi:MAG: aldehyde dehydrogenase family protein, partial [Bacteriovoracaceae bacterium]
MREQKFIIGGEWRTGNSTITIADLFSGAEIASVHQAGQRDINDAVISAEYAFAITSAYSGYDRSKILQSIVDGIRERKEDFARLITSEVGKPITYSRAEVDRAISTFTIAAEESTRMYGEVLPLDITPAAKGRKGIINRFPCGIVVCITPFNFPLNLVAHKIAPAIAAGNSFILKPAPQAPMTALLFGEVLLSSGLEKRSINILPTTNELAEQLAMDERIAMLSFTGSARVGWKLKSVAGKKKTALELGGNASVIVHKDADIPFAVARCIAGAFGYAGQVCIKVQRIFVHYSIIAQFEQAFVAETLNVCVGNPADERTVVGPMISEREVLRVESWVNEAVQHGATVLTGGVRSDRFYQPTILKNVDPSMKVCMEEVFGPVVTLESYTDLDEAVNKVNNSRYGLQAGIFTNDHAAIQYAYHHLQVGGVIVNDYPTFRVDNMPYGGIKDSGFGREGVRYAMQEMSDPKLLV